MKGIFMGEQIQTKDKTSFFAKHKDLIQIQDELISKFGDEAKGINLVTGEIEEQKKAIEDLAKADYKKYIQENQKEYMRKPSNICNTFTKNKRVDRKQSLK